jgi:hypothetical protein
VPGWAHQGRDRSGYSAWPLVAEPLLCDACEERLAPDARYVARLAYRDGGLPLLRHATPVAGPRPGMRVASLRGFDFEAMARFAAAMFWRTQVSSRPEARGLALSRAQAESLREYLMRARPTPLRMCLTLAALVDGDGDDAVVTVGTSFPVTEVEGDDGWHQFAVAGLVFSLSVGAKAAGTGGICLACGHDPHVVLTGWDRVQHEVTMTDALLFGARRSRPRSIPPEGSHR